MMRYGVWVVMIAVLAVAVAVCSGWLAGDWGVAVTASATASEKADIKEAEVPKGLPPLVVDKHAPLLLDEPPEVDPYDVPIGPVADNSACFVCHTNYEEEPLAVVHAQANVGCMKCHGKSLDHRDDENNITPPDIMFAPDKIAANCEKCHEEHDVAAADVIARWQERCPAKTDPKTILCTDCHGQHRLKIRTVWWDKNTGELIVRKNDETVKRAPDLTAAKPDEKKKPDMEMQ